MREHAINRLAAAIRGTSGKVVREHHPLPQRAVVREIDPLTVELAESNLMLEDEDLTVTQHVRRYDRDYGLEVGDTVVVIPVSGGEFVVTSVISKKHTFQGVQTERLPAAQVTQPVQDFPAQVLAPGVTLQVVGWHAVHDKDGEIIGYTRIWGTVEP